MIIGLVSFSDGACSLYKMLHFRLRIPPTPHRTSDEATLLDSKCRASQPRRFFLPPESKTYYEFIVGTVSCCCESNADAEIVWCPFEISTLHLYEKVSRESYAQDVIKACTYHNSKKLANHLKNCLRTLPSRDASIGHSDCLK
jgi:hypothetical protein